MIVVHIFVEQLQQKIHPIVGSVCLLFGAFVTLTILGEALDLLRADIRLT